LLAAKIYNEQSKSFKQINIEKFVAKKSCTLPLHYCLPSDNLFILLFLIINQNNLKMKKILILFGISLFLISCTDSAEDKDVLVKSDAPVALPYTAAYASDFTDDVSDNDLLAVLNSYKYWETGDMTMLAETLGDSVTFFSWDGFKFSGTKGELMDRWSKSRDSLSSVQITVDAWRKSHSKEKDADFIGIWYKEITTTKTGKVDSAYYQDDNLVKDGKIIWYSQHKQFLK
jgi:hypothetical protein